MLRPRRVSTSSGNKSVSHSHVCNPVSRSAPEVIGEGSATQLGGELAGAELVGAVEERAATELEGATLSSVEAGFSGRG